MGHDSLNRNLENHGMGAMMVYYFDRISFEPLIAKRQLTIQNKAQTIHWELQKTNKSKNVVIYEENITQIKFVEHFQRDFAHKFHSKKCF